MSDRIVALSIDECLALLSTADFGRIGVIEDGFPLVFPVSYHLAFHDGQTALAIRTRSGSVLDQPMSRVCFQIDGIDPGHDSGWSVLVRGTMSDNAADADSFYCPLLPDDHDSWHLVIPLAITGRRLLARPARWSLHPAGYL